MRVRQGSAEILVEGVRARDLLAMPAAELDTLVLGPRQLVFSIGSARILGGFRVHHGTLTIELGHVDGGGEGVLRALWWLATRFAQARGLVRVEWLVHAVSCPRPNLKLRRVLERRGFTVEDVPDVGRVYRLHQAITPDGFERS